MQADLKALEFDGIRRLLEKLCSTPFGAEAARNLEPAPDLGIARQMQDAVTAELANAAAGRKTVAQALTDAQTKVNSLLG